MNLKNKRILVTGGTGFIGAAIVNKLINQGCYVNIISLSKEFIWRIDDKSNHKFLRIDLKNPYKVKRCIQNLKPEIIFHLAGDINSVRDLNYLNKSFSTNFNGTKNLLQSLNKYEYDLFINTGSAEEYGNIKVPFKETDREKPVSPYSASKVATTYLCEMMANTFDKPVITIRPFLIYGPKQISRGFIPSLIFSGIEKKKISLTLCEQTREFLYIDDVVEAYISLANNFKKVRKMGIFNLGTGKEIKLLDIVNLIRKKLNDTKFMIGDKPYKPGEPMHFFASIDKINKAIGWAPKWNF
ncbi:MAG: NAD-dependent epimerase/dehydratase family protein, partial [Promethearchaeota archaeon]